jgi:hypothetical protein
VDLTQAENLGGRLRRTSWFGDVRGLAQSVLASRQAQGRLLVAGHPDDEPWHLSAHLDLLARYRDLPELAPTLTTGEDLAGVTRHDTVLFVSELAAPSSVLERLWDARKGGAAILGLSTVDEELAKISDDVVCLGAAPLDTGGSLLFADFELATHMFGVAAASPVRRRWFASR